MWMYYMGHVGCDITRSSYFMKPVTEKMREALDRMEAMGRGRCSDCPVLVNQYGKLFHTYRTYLYGDIFEFTSKTEATFIAKIAGEVLYKHPQLWDRYVCDTVVKMADEGMIKWVKKDEENSFRSLIAVQT